MKLQRCALCLFSSLAGVLLAASLLAAVGVAQAALNATRPYPGAAPCDTTLQTCINNSNPGDVIQIAAGTYTQSFTLNKSVSLVGAGANVTWLIAQPSTRVFTITSGVTSTIVISGVTIAGGQALALDSARAAACMCTLACPG